MKILQVHNKYQLSGGEDVVVENERRLLESKGHEVFLLIKFNDEITRYSILKKINLISTSVWSKSAYNEIKNTIRKIKPDICHVHNYMPLVSPSVFYACSELNVPVVQTLHNYRMICANAYLFREGQVCEECIGKSLYHGVRYGCYRNSRLQTFTVARMIETHKKKDTWKNKVDAYIALSSFSKNKFIEGGLSESKIQVKPNFISNDPGFNYNAQNHYLFAGRLDVTKGIEILVNAIVKLNGNIDISVAGDGTLKSEIQNNKEISYLGQLPKGQLLNQIKSAIALIFPSPLYENMPLSITEAFACGKPVIASNLGAMAELIEDGKTGLLFEPGNAEDLASKINWADEHKEEMKQMGMNARKEYEEKYTSEMNYKMLMEIYNKAIESSKLNNVE